MNAIRNAIFIFYFLLLVLTIVIGFTVVNKLKTETQANLDLSDPLTKEISDNTDLIQNTVFLGLQFIIALVTMLLLFSSFVERGNIMSYLMNFIGGVIITAILSYAATQFYNEFVNAGTGILDFSYLINFFIDNMQTLFFVNLIAGALSFIFVGR